jgi:hypothetical protein
MTQMYLFPAVVSGNPHTVMWETHILVLHRCRASSRTSLAVALMVLSSFQTPSSVEYRSDYQRQTLVQRPSASDSEGVGTGTSSSSSSAIESSWVSLSTSGSDTVLAQRRFPLTVAIDGVRFVRARHTQNLAGSRHPMRPRANLVVFLVAHGVVG